MDMKGKVIVVTGGGSGIGAGLVRRFAQEGAAGLVVADLAGDKASAVAAEVSGGTATLAVQLDVSKEAEVQALIAQATQRFDLQRDPREQHPEADERRESEVHADGPRSIVHGGEASIEGIGAVAIVASRHAGLRVLRLFPGLFVGGEREVAHGRSPRARTPAPKDACSSTRHAKALPSTLAALFERSSSSKTR